MMLEFDSCDGWNLIRTASDLRVWKARASEKLGMMRDRERVALQYNEKLK